MTIYTPLMDSPADLTAILDGLTGMVAFLAGIDRPQAQVAVDLYQAGSSRTGATWDRDDLSITDGATVIHLFWETDISVTQTHAWTTVWTQLVIEDRLAPSGMLIDCFEAIIKAGRIV
ncbi:MAG: hypothetical protein ACK5II_06905 [Paracoccus sp. (in: a-proteobacteria)]